MIDNVIIGVGSAIFGATISTVAHRKKIKEYQRLTDAQAEQLEKLIEMNEKIKSRNVTLEKSHNMKEVYKIAMVGLEKITNVDMIADISNMDIERINKCLKAIDDSNKMLHNCVNDCKKVEELTSDIVDKYCERIIETVNCALDYISGVIDEYNAADDDEEEDDDDNDEVIGVKMDLDLTEDDDEEDDEEEDEYTFVYPNEVIWNNKHYTVDPEGIGAITECSDLDNGIYVANAKYIPALAKDLYNEFVTKYLNHTGGDATIEAALDDMDIIIFLEFTDSENKTMNVEDWSVNNLKLGAVSTSNEETDTSSDHVDDTDENISEEDSDPYMTKFVDNSIGYLEPSIHVLVDNLEILRVVNPEAGESIYNVYCGIIADIQHESDLTDERVAEFKAQFHALRTNMMKNHGTAIKAYKRKLKESGNV